MLTENTFQKTSRRACADTPEYRMEDFTYDKKLDIYLSPSGAGALRESEEYGGRAAKKANSLPASFHELADRLKEWTYREQRNDMRNNPLEGVSDLLDNNSAVLEICPEDGISTRWLGERFRYVDAIEGDLRKAIAARMATSGMDNVKIFFGDILKTSFRESYNLITMISVTESILFHGGRPLDPAGQAILLLKRLGESLKEKGIIALAIENKLGLKYLSGRQEIPAPAFSRNEIESIFKESGFKNMQFYHPFPDHKVTRTIIAESDEVLSLRPYNWIRAPAEYPVPYPLLLKTMTDAALLWQLSDSFLVLASKSGNIDLKAGWLIKKLNNEAYDKKFHHSITLEKNGPSKYVIKRASIYGGRNSFNSQDVDYHLESKEYVEGELLSLDLYNDLSEKDQAAAIGRTMKVLYDSLMANYYRGINDENDYPLVSGDAVDYTLWNLIPGKDGELIFIDKKWKVKGDIPADLVLFRNLFHAHVMVHQYLKEKNRARFIIDIIRHIYPQYSLDRLKYDVRLEEKFQSALCGHKVLIGMSGPVESAINYLSIIHRRLGTAERK